MRLSILLRWTARIWAAISVVFLGIMIAGHFMGSEPQELRSWYEVMTLSFFPGLLFLGLLMGWKWELIGGCICLASMIGLYALRPDLLGDVLIPSLAAPGLLFIVRGWWERRLVQT